MIVFEDVSFSYAAVGGAVSALCGIDLVLPRASVTCLVGANGSGKSTLAMLCDGLLVPTGGTVTVDGLDTADPASTWEVRRRVGMVFQDPDDQIVGTSVEGDAAFGPENLGVPPDDIRRRISEALHTVGLSGLEGREPHLLSEGQKQRLAIAGAIAMDPEHLVLDEPTAMLDPQGRVDVLAVTHRVAQEGTGVLHITHRLEEVAVADRVVALIAGSVAFDGPPAEFLADAELLGSCGVSGPPLWDVAQRLRDVGAPVPVTALSVDVISEALWS